MPLETGNEEKDRSLWSVAPTLPSSRRERVRTRQALPCHWLLHSVRFVTIYLPPAAVGRPGHEHQIKQTRLLASVAFTVRG